MINNTCINSGTIDKNINIIVNNTDKTFDNIDSSYDTVNSINIIDISVVIVTKLAILEKNTVNILTVMVTKVTIGNCEKQIISDNFVTTVKIWVIKVKIPVPTFTILVTTLNKLLSTMVVPRNSANSVGYIKNTDNTEYLAVVRL